MLSTFEAVIAPGMFGACADELAAPGEGDEFAGASTEGIPLEARLTSRDGCWPARNFPKKASSLPRYGGNGGREPSERTASRQL